MALPTSMCDQCQRRQTAAVVAYLQARPGGTGSGCNMAAVHLSRPIQDTEICISTKHIVHNIQVQELGEKLAELEKDCADLKEYQQVDRQRRALEFNIYDADLTDTREQLEQVHSRPQAHTLSCLR